MKKGTCELGTCVQRDDNGTFTALLVMEGLTEDEAEEMCIVMRDAVHTYLVSQGVHPIAVVDTLN